MSFKLNENIIWKEYKISTNGDKRYVPYVVINNESYYISNITIEVNILRTGDPMYFLNLGLFQYCIECDSVSSAMVKAEERLRDLKFVIYATDPSAKRVGKLICKPINYRVTHPIIGWKKAWNRDCVEVIVKVKIPKDTKCNLSIEKCRAEKAEILEVYAIIRKPNPKSGKDKITLQKLPKTTDIYSIYTSIKLGIPLETLDNRFGDAIYHTGDTLVVNNFDISTEPCSPGIHFFRSITEAIDYVL